MRQVFLGLGTAVILLLLIAMAMRLQQPGQSQRFMPPAPPALFTQAAPTRASRPTPPLPPAPLPAEEQKPAAVPLLPAGEKAGIIINEVQYHPPGKDRRDEWIELYNRGSEAVDLSGWKFVEGIEFTFPPGTILGADRYLVVAASAARLKETLGLESAAGDWTGSLSDGGERIKLVDARGGEVESLEYKDGLPFPALADGYGRSLERRRPGSPASFPGNWGASTTSGGWLRYQTRGLATSGRLYLYLLGPGTVFIDDLSIREDGGENLVPGGDFESGPGRWAASGSHAASGITSEAAHQGKRSLKVSAESPGSSRTSSVMQDGLPLQDNREYTLEFWAFFQGPPSPLVIRLSNSRQNSQALFIETGIAATTPGRRNSIHSETLPPFIHPVSCSPARPAPGEAVEISAKIAAQKEITRVFAHIEDGGVERAVELRRKEGDLFTASIGSFSEGSLVRYHLSAEDQGGGKARFPFEENPTPSLGFYIQSRADSGEFPTYRLFLPANALDNLNSNPYSDAYYPGILVYNGEVYFDVGMRYRGQTSRSNRKHHWKLKFTRDHPFVPHPGHEPVRTFNLNSCYSDKTFLRESLSFSLFRDLGETHCETWFTRVELNGSYLGFYMYLENPGDEYLKRNELEEGWLWKAYSNATHGASGFELETGDAETGAAALSEFISSINRLSGKELDAYLLEHLNVEAFIDYLAATQLIHNTDHIAKNYLIYAGPDMKFTYLPWDLDLTHGRNYECQGGGVLNDQMRYDSWDEERGDRQLLYGTRANPKCEGYWNGLIDAFLYKTGTFRTRYHQKVAELLTHHYHPNILLPKVKRLRQKIHDEAVKDRQRWGSYGGDADFDRNCDQLERWITKRFQHLSKKLQALGCPIGAPLNADFEVDRPGAAAAPLEVSFKNLSSGDITSYEWDFGDGSKSAEKEPRHAFTKPGRYDVSLKANGAQDSHTLRRRGAVRIGGK